MALNRLCRPVGITVPRPTAGPAKNDAVMPCLGTASGITFFWRVQRVAMPGERKQRLRNQVQRMEVLKKKDGIILPAN